MLLRLFCLTALAQQPAPENHPPTVKPLTLTTREDVATSSKVEARDADKDALTFEVTTAPAHGTATIDATGKLSFTPTDNFNGSDALEVTVRDATTATVAAVSINVTAVNDAPTGAALALETNEDTAREGKVEASDVDGDALTFKVGQTPKHGTATVDAKSGALVYTPSSNFFGSDAFSVSVSDGTASSSIPVTVTVVAVNDAPEAKAVTLSTKEDVVGKATVVARDVDGDALSFSVSKPPAHGEAVVDAKTGALQFTPTADWSGSDECTIDVKDAVSTTSVAVTLNISPVNDLPTVAAGKLELQEDAPCELTLDARDIDGDTLTFSIGEKPKLGTVSVDEKAGKVTFTPSPNKHGSDSFSIKASDGKASSSATIHVVITAVNDSPTLAALTLATNEDTEGHATANGNDVDGDALTYSVSKAPAHGSATIDAKRGQLTYVPEKNFNGDDTLSISVSDGTATTSADVSIKVAAVNDAPTTAPLELSTNEDVAVSGAVHADDVDGDALTYKLSTPPSHGKAVVDERSGQLTYTPNTNSTADDSFTVTVSEGKTSAPARVTVKLTAVNDEPTLKPLSMNGAEDTTLHANVSASDVDGDKLTFSIKAAPAHGEARVEAGAVTYTPARDFNGEDGFELEVSDGKSTAAAHASVTVTPVNDAPTAGALEFAITEDTAGSLTVTGNDVDADALTYKLATPPQHGKASVDAQSGQLTYTPNTNSTADDVLVVSVSDGKATANARVTVKLTAVNDEPTLKAVSLSGAEDSVLRGNASASDVDGDKLTFSIKSAAAHGEARVDGSGGITFTPARDFNGTDGFELEVTDGKASTTAHVEVTVQPSNDAPTTSAQTATLDEDSTWTGTLEANDVDGDALTFKSDGAPKHGTLSVDPKSGALTYSPSKDFHGDDSFDVSVSDGKLSARAHVTLTVKAINDAPVVTALSLKGAEDTKLTATLAARDVDGDRLSYALGKSPEHGEATVNATSGLVSYTPAANFNGSDTFSVTASDGTASASAEVTVSITAVNDAPTAQASSVTTAEDTVVSGSITTSDVDGDALTFSLGNGPAKGSVTVDKNTGAFTYTPKSNANGADSFSITVNDGQAHTQAEVKVEISKVNDAPTLEPLALTTNEDSAARGTLKALDVDADALTFTLTKPASNGTATVVAKSGAVTYQPSRDFFGDDSFEVSVGDGQATTNAMVSVKVSSVNDAPVGSSGEQACDEDTACEGALTASDVDGDALSFSVGRKPAHGSITIDAKSGSFTFTPSRDFHGSDSFTFDVTDGKQKGASATVALTIRAVNDAPQTKAITLKTVEDTSARGVVTGSDLDGDKLSFSIGQAPPHGTASVDAKGNVIYQPAKDFFGTDECTVDVSDGTTSTPAAVSITVTPVNDPPMASTGRVETNEDTPVEGRLSGMDPDEDALTFRLLSAPTKGKAELLDAARGTWRYTPNLDAIGADEVAFEVADRTASAKSTMQIVINPINDAPVMGKLEVQALEDTPLEVQLLATDVDGDPLTFALVSQPAQGRVTLVDASKGTFRFEPPKQFNGDLRFTATVSDGKKTSSAETVVLHVGAQNDPPVAAAGSLSTAEDTPVAGTFKATDIDGDALTYRVSRKPPHGSVQVVDARKGSFLYTPAADFNGNDAFEFSADDGAGGTGTATISIAISPVDDAPTGVPETLGIPRRGSITGRIHGFDREGKPLTFRLVTKPSAGRLSLTDDKTGDFTFSSDGIDESVNLLRFKFVVSDGALTSEPTEYRLQLESF